MLPSNPPAASASRRSFRLSGKSNSVCRSHVSAQASAPGPASEALSSEVSSDESRSECADGVAVIAVGTSHSANWRSTAGSTLDRGGASDWASDNALLSSCAGRLFSCSRCFRTTASGSVSVCVTQLEIRLVTFVTARGSGHGLFDCLCFLCSFFNSTSTALAARHSGRWQYFSKASSLQLQDLVELGRLKWQIFFPLPQRQAMVGR
mmetsp:Transcript_58342/g.125512  ORF Transcript_58342/g.125512 Transcript_58342/m.125512 type:complete len:207 (-) Transcript_58342:21-641(-)